MTQRDTDGRFVPAPKPEPLEAFDRIMVAWLSNQLPSPLWVILQNTDKLFFEVLPEQMPMYQEHRPRFIHELIRLIEAHISDAAILRRAWEFHNQVLNASRVAPPPHAPEREVSASMPAMASL
jgi:hypothetical protein